MFNCTDCKHFETDECCYCSLNNSDKCCTCWQMAPCGNKFTLYKKLDVICKMCNKPYEVIEKE